MDRKADARWLGDLINGKGTVRLGTGAFEGPYSFTSRFEHGAGTTPEELLGAAHASCYSMALAHGLAQAGHPATEIATTATVSLEKTEAGFSITKIHLETRGKVPGLSAADFQKHAEDMKKGCIVSRALASVPMTLDAQLV